MPVNDPPNLGMSIRTLVALPPAVRGVLNGFLLFQVAGMTEETTEWRFWWGIVLFQEAAGMGTVEGVSGKFFRCLRYKLCKIFCPFCYNFSNLLKFM